MKSVFPSWYRISANVDRQPRATLPKKRERERERERERTSDQPRLFLVLEPKWMTTAHFSVS